MTIKEIVAILKSKKNLQNIEGMKRFGIRGKILLGISMADLRKLAKKIGKDHKLALELWKTEIHEARMVACLVESPDTMTAPQMEKWVREIDSWDVCDMMAGNLLDKSEAAIKNMPQWAKDKREFVRRTPLSMIAWLAVHKKDWQDKDFEKYFSLIKKTASDERNFVKKAVNWALRQIGKRNMNLHQRALEVAGEIRKMESKSAKWIANGAINELSAEKTIAMIKRKNQLGNRVG